MGLSVCFLRFRAIRKGAAGGDFKFCFQLTREALFQFVEARETPILIGLVGSTDSAVEFGNFGLELAAGLSGFSTIAIETKMPDTVQLGHSTNLVGIASACIANQHFNLNPVPMRIGGTRESAHGLFDILASQKTLEDCGMIFQDYMYEIFEFESEQQRKKDHLGRRRYRNSYLKLIQDWGFDSNNAQRAVLKAWIESRFGLFPIFHKVYIDGFMTPVWMQYLEEKMNSRYHNNSIYIQLDLLSEFCQWVVEHFQCPAAKHKTLYRGVNTLDDLLVPKGADGKLKVVRFNNLISFTDRRSIASEFGAYILEVAVPMVKLVFFSDLLPHHALRGEREFLVIGGDYPVKVSR